MFPFSLEFKLASKEERTLAFEPLNEESDLRLIELTETEGMGVAAEQAKSKRIKVVKTKSFKQLIII